MKLYFAPLEGIGGYIYRNAQAECFTRGDKYFSPFLAPKQNRFLSPKEYRDVAPENNGDLFLVPQIMANDAKIFLGAAKELKELGYGEVNLNLGCPSPTVVTKYRGAGFLAKPRELESFLEEIFEGAEIKISIKTRLGMEREEEFYPLLELYNRFPVEELIIHPRVQKDLYKNTPRREMFSYAQKYANCPLVYNGDIFSKGDYEIFADLYGDIPVMLGRGVLRNPALFGEIKGRETMTKERLYTFHYRLLEDYIRVMSGEKNVLFKMKELWFYMAEMFADCEKYIKKIRKAQHLAEYRAAVEQLFEKGEFKN